MLRDTGLLAPLNVSPVGKAGGLPSPLPTLSSSSPSSSLPSFSACLNPAFCPPKRGVVLLNRDPPVVGPKRDPPVGPPKSDPDVFDAPNKLPDPNTPVPAVVVAGVNLNPPPKIELPDVDAFPNKPPPLVVVPVPRLPNKLPAFALTLVVASFLASSALTSDF